MSLRSVRLFDFKHVVSQCNSLPPIAVVGCGCGCLAPPHVRDRCRRVFQRHESAADERVRYAKVESPPQPTQVAAAVQASAGLVTIFGGAGGTYLIEELRRGALGTMPWPSQPQAFVRIWDLWQAGDERGAMDLHEREIAPLARLATAGIRLGHTIHKEILRRRGVIANALVRGPSDPLDALTRRELDQVCDRLGIGSAVA